MAMAEPDSDSLLPEVDYCLMVNNIRDILQG